MLPSHKNIPCPYCNKIKKEEVMYSHGPKISETLYKCLECNEHYSIQVEFEPFTFKDLEKYKKTKQLIPKMKGDYIKYYINGVEKRDLILSRKSAKIMKNIEWKNNKSIVIYSF